METFVTSHQTVRGAAVMWWFRPPPLLLPSCWKECHYVWPTRHQISCSHDHMLHRTSLILQQDIMYIHRDHQTWNISVCTHSVLMCVNRTSVTLVHSALCELACLQPRIWESSCRHMLLPSFENEFPIALLKSALCQRVWQQHCFSVGVSGLWKGGPIREGTMQYIIKKQARKSYATSLKKKQ